MTLVQVLIQLRLIVKEEIRELAIELLQIKSPYRWNGGSMDLNTRARVISLAQQICSLNGKEEVHYSGSESF